VIPALNKKFLRETGEQRLKKKKKHRHREKQQNKKKLQRKSEIGRGVSLVEANAQGKTVFDESERDGVELTPWKKMLTRLKGKTGD